jgi:glycosyltransferase involved in cell wall biosynthesis
MCPPGSNVFPVNLPSISVFFPAYHDEDNIGKMAERSVEVLEGLGCEYEVIIVHDGSPDRTGEVADELARRHAGLRVIHHTKNLGYGAALKTGFTNARNEYIFYTDGDNQFDVGEMVKFVPLVSLGLTDLVIGFRNRKQYSLYRKVTSFTYNLVLQVLFDLPYRDVDCAFKLVPKSLIDRIDIYSVDAFIDAEILIKAQQLGYSITEVGVNHYLREAGTSGVKTKVILRTIREMVHFYLHVRSEDRERTPL